MNVDFILDNQGALLSSFTEIDIAPIVEGNVGTAVRKQTRGLADKRLLYSVILGIISQGEFWSPQP